MFNRSLDVIQISNRDHDSMFIAAVQGNVEGETEGAHWM